MKSCQEIFYEQLEKSKILLENQAVEIISYQEAIKEGHNNKIELIQKYDEVNQKLVEKDTLVFKDYNKVKII